MKVLQINSFFSVGGPPRIMNGIYDTLVENEYDCKLAAAREKIYSPEDSIIIGNKVKTYANAIKARIMDNEGLSARKATEQLIAEIEKYDPDIIQLHNLHGYYINIETLFTYLKKSGKPVVWTMHDCWAVTGHCAHFSTIGCDRYKSGCFSCPQKTSYPSSYIIDHSKRNWVLKKAIFTGMEHMVIVTPSHWLENIMRQSYLETYPIEVIHNGIDLNSFSKQEGDISYKYGLKGKKIILGVAQNWSEHKGFEDFIKLADLLDESYQIVMIGLTDNQVKRIPESILGLKRTNSVNELAQWYSSAHVFVNLTYQDNFPTVNIEALACGTPVITYDTGGSPEAVDESCGWVVEQGNLREVARLIKRIDTGEELRNAARSRSKLFDRRKKYQEYICLYLKLIKESKGYTNQ